MVGAVTGRSLEGSHLSRWSVSGQRGGAHLELLMPHLDLETGPI